MAESARRVRIAVASRCSTASARGAAAWAVKVKANASRSEPRRHDVTEKGWGGFAFCVSVSWWFMTEFFSLRVESVRRERR
jgi:hypothetical protein